jgi:glucosamine--fructose-6-phosphate aminotransferase (isomerizing)
MQNGSATVLRSEGKLSRLEQSLKDTPLQGTCGIGHTRWATHGRPSEKNAHPHKAGPVVVVHNGIIENYGALKQALRQAGHTFKSETDTEVIAHLIEQKIKEGTGFEDAVRRALPELKGAYAICVLCEHEPETLIAAKQGSPLVVGLGTEEFFVASDSPAILSSTREMVFMEDGEMAIFRGRERSFQVLTAHR